MSNKKSSIPATEKRIAKVTHIDLTTHLAEGIAENMTYSLVLSPFTEPPLKCGDFVVCHVLNEEETDEFYLEQIPNHALSDENEWNNQEIEYR